MHALAILTLSTALPLSALAVLRTVDDNDPRWVYSGSTWHAIRPGSPCGSCNLNPDSALALNSTWHDSTDATTAELEFTGISLEVYVICAFRNWHEALNASITIDNETHSASDILSPATTGFHYNHLAFAMRSLPLTNHHLTIRNVDESPLLLDYVIYDDGVVEPIPTVTSTHTLPRETKTLTMTASPSQALLAATRSQIQSNKAVIATSVLFGLSLLAHIVLFFWWRSRNPQRSLPQHSSADLPSTTQVNPPQHSGAAVRMSIRTPTTEPPINSRQMASLLPNTTHKLPPNTIAMMVDQNTIQIVPKSGVRATS